jgi:CheY-like chemotaxis protein
MTQRTILVADDDQAIRDLLARTLRDVGYAILTAEDGRKAVAPMRRC